METNTTFLPQNILHNKILKEISILDNLNSKIDILLQEDLYPLKKDNYHFVAKMLSQLGNKNSRETKAFTSLLFQSIYRAEIISAGSSEIAFRFGIPFTKHIIRSKNKKYNNIDLQNDLNTSIEYFIKLLKDFSKSSKEEDIENIIMSSAGSDGILNAAVWEAIKMAGVEGKIFIENGKQDNFVVEHKDGYNFNLNPFNFMIGDNKNWHAYDCKVIIVDGLVEKVSEIDHLLTKTLETKQPMVIIAQGFSEEVVATIKTNNDRGLINVQPVRIPTGIESLNVSNDISVVCGTLPISIMKGDILTFVKYEDIPTVEHIKLTDKQCTIENFKTRSAVSSQIRSLLEKRQSHYLHEEVQEMLDKRIRSLVSNTVVIYLPNSAVNIQDERRIKIDLALRQTKTILNNGVVNTKELLSVIRTNKQIYKNMVEKCFFESVKISLEQKGEQNLSPLSIFVAYSFISKTILSFLYSSGIVKIVK